MGDDQILRKRKLSDSKTHDSVSPPKKVTNFSKMADILNFNDHKDYVKHCLIDKYVFTCPLLLLGLSRSGKTTFLCKYIYEWCKDCYINSMVCIVLILTSAQGTIDSFNRLAEMCLKNSNGNKNLYVYTYDDFSKFTAFYTQLMKKSKDPTFTAKIFCIVDDKPEALSGDKKQNITFKEATKFWSMIASRGSHLKTQLIISVQSLSMISSTEIKSQIKIITLFNRLNNEHLSKLFNQIPALANVPITKGEINGRLPEPILATDDHKQRDFKNLTIGINDNNTIIDFVYRVPLKFSNHLCTK